MIIFQLTLSGQQLRTLVAIKHGNALASNIPSFVSSANALLREHLVTHESCVCKPRHPADGSHKFPTKGRKWHWEITTKGELALQLAAQDLHDFLEEVTGELAPGPYYGTLLQEQRIATGRLHKTERHLVEAVR